MNNRITLLSVKTKRFLKKVRSFLHRKFDFSFSVGRKKNPNNPPLAVNVKGELPKELVAILALIGAITAIWGIWKVIRKFI